MIDIPDFKLGQVREEQPEVYSVIEPVIFATVRNIRSDLGIEKTIEVIESLHDRGILRVVRNDDDPSIIGMSVYEGEHYYLISGTEIRIEEKGDIDGFI